MKLKEFKIKAKKIGVGKKIKTKIQTIKKTFVIEEAVLQKEKNTWYICQNIVEGTPCNDKLGYKYSFIVRNNFSAQAIKYIELAWDSKKPYRQIPIYDNEENIIGWKEIDKMFVKNYFYSIRKGGCQRCGILVGPDYKHKKFKKWNGYNICSSCYQDKINNIVSIPDLEDYE